MAESLANKWKHQQVHILLVRFVGLQLVQQSKKYLKNRFWYKLLCFCVCNCDLTDETKPGQSIIISKVLKFIYCYSIYASSQALLFSWCLPSAFQDALDIIVCVMNYL